MAKKEKENKTQKRHFFKDMKAELKKVIWPSAKQTANNTVAVIAFALAVGIIVLVLDLIFEFGSGKVVDLQNTIKSSYSTNSTTAENTNSEENATDENNAANDTNVTVETNTENSGNTENKK